MINLVDRDRLEDGAVERALAQRLGAVVPFLCDVPPLSCASVAVLQASLLLDLLTRAVHDDPRPEQVWLLCTAVSGTFPTAYEVLEGVRLFRLESIVRASLWLLDLAAHNADNCAGSLQIVTNQVVIDVDHSARHDLHTGIQQVVRRTLPIWTREHEVILVAWTDRKHCFRVLSAQEHARVLRRDHKSEENASDALRPRLVVPWRTVVVLAETPAREACERLAAVAELSGNAVVAIGYDCIPIVSADLVPQYEPGRFAHYLTIIKHARRLAAISASARVEFAGFVKALAAQGIDGPDVIECVLPAESVALDKGSGTALVSTATRFGPPLVLTVGSLEPRKNHLALLYAADRLWREGHEFALLLIGRGGWGDDIADRVARLQGAGRQVQIRSQVSDHELVEAYLAARFTVFASLHEGYGLPVAESLSLGTPVITSDYGSTREIGLAGGAVLINPRDDEQLVSAMRALLTDDDLLVRLRAETTRRPSRTWEHYATELWGGLVAPALDSMRDETG